MTRRRLGLLGPIIVLVGAAAAAAAIVYMVHARPEAGEAIDTIAIDAGEQLVVRREAGGNRSFLELRAGDKVKWQAYIPRYAGSPGRPAVAVDPASSHGPRRAPGPRRGVRLRAIRRAQGRDRSTRGRTQPIRMHAEGPITLTDHERSYELVGGADWNELIAIDLSTGAGLWKVDLGKGPIRAGGVEDQVVWLQHGERRRRWTRAAFLDLMRIRTSSTLFRLPGAADVHAHSFSGAAFNTASVCFALNS